MKTQKNYTVQTYYDSRDESHTMRYAKDYFSHKYTNQAGVDIFFEDRGKIAKNEVEFICGYCKQSLCICGGRGKNIQKLHFRHRSYDDSKHCIYEEPERLTAKAIERIKFNGAKEGAEHKWMKEFIAKQLLSMESPKLSEDDVHMEKILRNEKQPDEYRRPDVFAKFPDKKVVFEIQLATTFLSVISERQIHYQNDGTYLIWVLNQFSSESRKQLFSQKDILVQNVYNVFVLDEEAVRLSKEHNTLFFHCYYVDFYIKDGYINDDVMKDEYVEISDLTFREKDYKVFYVDAESKRDHLRNELDLIRQKQIIEKKRQEDLQAAKIYENWLKNLSILNKEASAAEYLNKMRFCNSSEKCHMQIGLFLHLQKIFLEGMNSMSMYNERFYDRLLSSELVYPHLIQFLHEYGISKLSDYAEYNLQDKNMDQPVFCFLVKHLMMNGYHFSDNEIERINSKVKDLAMLVKNESVEAKIKNEVVRFSLLMFYYRIQLSKTDENTKKIYYQLVYKHLLVFIRILCVFLHSVVGCNLNNLAAVSDNMKSMHSEFGHLFLAAAETPSGKCNIYCGKSGSDNLQKLKAVISDPMFKKDCSLDELFLILFPQVKTL